MANERTLSIIKPDATERNITGLIIARLEAAGLRVIAQKRVWWKKKDARRFYDIHKDQPFFRDLVNFMTSYALTDKVDLRFSVDNVFDEFYPVSVNWTGKRVLPGAPRTFRLGTSFKF